MNWKIFFFLLVPLVCGMVAVAALLVVSKVPLSYNVRNLAVRWRTTVLTALAFTLVVALLIVMLAFVNGMYRLTEGSGQPGNIMVLSDGATDELFSNLPYQEISNIEREPGVLRDDRDRPLSSREIYLVVNQPIPHAEEKAQSRSLGTAFFEVLLHGTTIQKTERPSRRFVSVRGVEDPAMAGRVHNLGLLEGQWFSESGVAPLPEREGTKDARDAIQAVIGEGLARELGPDIGKKRLAAGDIFELGPRKWIVTGIMNSAGSAFDSEVWGKRELVGPMFGKSNISSMVLRTQPGNAKALADHLTANFKESALAAQPESEYYSKLSDSNQQFLIGIIVISIIMAVGGIFGVMNTMYAAISQRIKDIGVLRILGFTPWQILVSFLLESLLIALIGGTIGCALGYLADGGSASSIVTGGLGGGGKSVMLKLVVDANILSAGLLFTLVMGTLGGLLPALSAMRLKPLESLR